MSNGLVDSAGGIAGEQELDTVTDELLKAYAVTRDARLRERLIVLHLDLVTSLARRLSYDTRQLEDLIQVGYIGLIKAIDRFDPSKGTRFSSYAAPTIAGEIKRYLRDKSKIIRVPRHVQERRAAIERVATELTQRLGHPPSAAEIAAELGLDPQDVAWPQEQCLDSPLSLECFSRPQDGSERLSIAEWVGDHDENMLRVEDRFLISRALERLTPRERAILYLLFYAGLSQAQIGQKLNISQMHVSRLVRAALNHLREELSESA